MAVNCVARDTASAVGDLCIPTSNIMGIGKPSRSGQERHVLASRCHHHTRLNNPGQLSHPDLRPWGGTVATAEQDKRQHRMCSTRGMLTRAP